MILSVVPLQVSHPAVHLARYPCKSVPGGISLPPTWHGIPAKVFQVSFPASHLARFSRESVPGVLYCRPPGTVFLRECSRCPFLLPTWHGFPARVFQVSFSAAHLARFSCESVPGVLLCRSPGTVFLRKCSRCPFPPPTCHGIPAKACQVSFPAVHLARNPCESVPGDISLLSTCHGSSSHHGMSGLFSRTN